VPEGEALMELAVTPFGTQVAARRQEVQPSATSHARIKHDCGEWVYTESRAPGAWPPVFPADCPYCGGGLGILIGEAA
jgi:hypothetical protein